MMITFPELRIVVYNATVIILVNLILFVLNWRKNKDIKSLAFAIGVLCLLIGESMSTMVPLINGICLIMTAIIWGMAYSGLLEKLISK